MFHLGAELRGIEVVGQEGDDVGVGQGGEDVDLVAGQVVVGQRGAEHLEGVVAA